MAAHEPIEKFGRRRPPYRQPYKSPQKYDEHLEISECKQVIFRCKKNNTYKLNYIDITVKDNKGRPLYDGTTYKNFFIDDIFKSNYSSSISIRYNVIPPKYEKIEGKYKLNIDPFPDFKVCTLRQLTTTQLLKFLQRVQYLSSQCNDICVFINEFKEYVYRNINNIISAKYRWIILVERNIDIQQETEETQLTIMNALKSLICSSKPSYKPEPILKFIDTDAAAPRTEYRHKTVDTKEEVKMLDESLFNLKNFERNAERIKLPLSQIVSPNPCVELSKSKSGLDEFKNRSVYLYFIDDEINATVLKYNKNQDLEHSTIQVEANFNTFTRQPEKDKVKLTFTKADTRINHITNNFIKLQFITTEQLLLMLNRVVYINDHQANLKINKTESIKKVLKQFIEFIKNNRNIIKERNIRWACFINKDTMTQAIEEDNNVIKYLTSTKYSDFDSLIDFLIYNIIEDPTELNEVYKKLKNDLTELTDEEILKLTDEEIRAYPINVRLRIKNIKRTYIFKSVVEKIKAILIEKNKISNPSILSIIKDFENKVDLNKIKIQQLAEDNKKQIIEQIKTINTQIEEKEKNNDITRILKQDDKDISSLIEEMNNDLKRLRRRELTTETKQQIQKIDNTIKILKDLDHLITQKQQLESKLISIDFTSGIPYIRDYTILIEMMKKILSNPNLLSKLYIAQYILLNKDFNIDVYPFIKADLIDTKSLFDEYIFLNLYKETPINWIYTIRFNVDESELTPDNLISTVNFDMRLNNLMLLDCIKMFYLKFKEIFEKDHKTDWNIIDWTLYGNKRTIDYIDTEQKYTKFKATFESFCSKVLKFIDYSETNTFDKLYEYVANEIYYNFYYLKIHQRIYDKGLTKLGISEFIDLVKDTATLGELTRAIYSYTDEKGEYHKGEDEIIDQDNQKSLKQLILEKDKSNPDFFYINGGSINNSLHKKYLSYVKKYNL